MTQKELHNRIKTQAGVPLNTIKAVLDALALVTQQAVANREDVELNGIGKLTVKPVAARTGRNPATGETIEIPAGHKVTYKAAKAVKQAVK